MSISNIAKSAMLNAMVSKATSIYIGATVSGYYYPSFAESTCTFAVESNQLVLQSDVEFSIDVSGANVVVSTITVSDAYGVGALGELFTTDITPETFTVDGTYTLTSLVVSLA